MGSGVATADVGVGRGVKVGLGVGSAGVGVGPGVWSLTKPVHALSHAIIISPAANERNMASDYMGAYDTAKRRGVFQSK
jgi:hypothetical protein